MRLSGRLSNAVFVCHHPSLVIKRDRPPEYLALLINHDPHDIDRIVPLPEYFATNKRDKKDIAKDTDLVSAPDFQWPCRRTARLVV